MAHHQHVLMSGPRHDLAKRRADARMELPLALAPKLNKVIAPWARRHKIDALPLIGAKEPLAQARFAPVRHIGYRLYGLMRACQR